MWRAVLLPCCCRKCAGIYLLIRPVEQLPEQHDALTVSWRWQQSEFLSLSCFAVVQPPWNGYCSTLACITSYMTVGSSLACCGYACRVHADISILQQQERQKQLQLDKAAQKLVAANADNAASYIRHRTRLSQASGDAYADQPPLISNSRLAATA